MKKLFIDFETRSAVDIKKVGAWAYARHPSTEILCMGWAIDGGKVNVTQECALGPAVPVYLAHDLVKSADRIVAHSAHFEYAIYRYVLHERYGWPANHDPARWDCTLARSVMCGLPPSLEHAGAALNIKRQKDLEGRAALMKLCKPIDIDPIDGTPVYNTDPELFEKLYRYNIRDVEAEMELDARLPEMPPAERAIWELDLVMNRRGVQTDTKLASCAAGIAETLTAGLNNRLLKITNGAVDKASRVQAMKKYLSPIVPGDMIEKLDKEAVTNILEDPMIPAHAKEVVSIRRQVGKSSTAKFTATLNAADKEDGRVRGALQYHAAATGRWGGRLIQPQNYPKGLDEKAQARAIDVVMNDDTGQMFDLIYGDQAMQTLSDILRGTIVAAPGHTLLVADYNAIEARVLFWLAGDGSALDCYRRGESPYVDMARYIYKNNAITKKGNPKEYDIGKRTILGCGYGMGAEKFKITVKIQANTDIPLDLAERAVKAYREKYSAVRNLWYAVEKAAINAVKTPGSVQACCGGKVAWGMDKKREFLCCRLPSGRHLRYYRPTVKTGESKFGGEKEELSYWTSGLSKELEQFKTYGGSLVENITQAVARDVMAAGMIKCETAGYPLILTCHDEIIAETPVLKGKSVEEMIKLMCDLPIWAAGLPIAAEGFASRRYRK